MRAVDKIPSLARRRCATLGHELLTANGAWIVWSGTITPRLGYGDGVLIPADEWFPWPSQIAAAMNPPGPGIWYATVGPVDGPFVAESHFDPLGSPGWGFLLDGIGEVESSRDPLIILGGIMVIPPQATIESAVLGLDVDWDPTSVSETYIPLLPWSNREHRVGPHLHEAPPAPFVERDQEPTIAATISRSRAS